VRYKGQVYIRVGPRRAIASESEERILCERRTLHVRTFDSRPCDGCGLDDLALDLFLVTYRSSAIAPEVLEGNRRDIRQQMASLRFYDLRKNCATFAGAILFGKDPLNWLPGAYVQFVRFRGARLTDDPVDEKRFSGDLLTVLRELDAFLPLQVQSRPEVASALRERQVLDYPVIALRELLMNAVLHRDYESNSPIHFYWFEDRVEIQNPGGLYGQATPENFPSQTDYRNPVIAEAMKALGYVNKFGRGVLRAQEALTKAGHPAPEFPFEPTHFLARIWRRR
jgi:ATP-dependent DNA helicase RecG